MHWLLSTIPAQKFHDWKRSCRRNSCPFRIQKNITTDFWVIPLYSLTVGGTFSQTFFDTDIINQQTKCIKSRLINSCISRPASFTLPPPPPPTPEELKNKKIKKNKNFPYELGKKVSFAENVFKQKCFKYYTEMYMCEYNTYRFFFLCNVSMHAHIDSTSLWRNLHSLKLHDNLIIFLLCFSFFNW